MNVYDYRNVPVFALYSCRTVWSKVYSHHSSYRCAQSVCPQSILITVDTDVHSLWSTVYSHHSSYRSAQAAGLLHRRPRGNHNKISQEISSSTLSVFIALCHFITGNHSISTAQFSQANAITTPPVARHSFIASLTQTNRPCKSVKCLSPIDEAVLRNNWVLGTRYLIVG